MLEKTKSQTTSTSEERSPVINFIKNHKKKIFVALGVVAAAATIVSLKKNDVILTPDDSVIIDFVDGVLTITEA